MAIGDPTDPKAPGSNQPMDNSNQPLDPGVANVFERMASALSLANEKAAASEETLKAMAIHAGALAEESGKAAGKLKDLVKMSDNIEENYKRLVDYGKKRLNMNQKDLQDARKAHKELKDMADLYEEALKNAKENTKEHKAMTTNLALLNKLMKNLKAEGELTQEEMKGIADAFDRASRNAKDLVKSMANLSRTGAAIKGAGGILGAMGIGRGINAKMERRMEQIQEVRDKIKESRELRKAATFKHMDKRREAAETHFKGMGIDTNTDAGRDLIARKIGFKAGTPKYDKFVKGSAAGGEAAGGEVGADYVAAMSEGGGAIEGVMATFETGMEGLLVGLEAVALPLTLLIGAIELLIGAFDGYVKQNQELEKGIGKAGLFTGGVGAGTAFMNARAALTPPVLGQGLGLGITSDRNLALASAMANSGMGGFNQEFAAPNTANQRPGAAGEFMAGGMGEMQRVVMGVSRVSGLTDQEGIDNLIKLMTEYRETVASSEMFMAQLNKDTQAAGISTTKYLKIIDDVSSHFDKMNKSLEQVTGVMREMSRYGAISSESLKDMMEFLTSAQQKTDLGNVATAAFTQTNLQGTKSLARERAVEKSTLSTYVKNLNQEAPEDFGQGLDIDDAISRGDYGGAQDQANAMQRRIDQIKSPVVKQNMQTALDKVKDQIKKVAGVMDNTALGRAASEAAQGTDPVQQMTNLFSNLRTSTQGNEGTFRKVLLEGGGNAEQKLLMQQLASMLGVKDPTKVAGILQREATNRLEEAEGSPMDQRRALLKDLFKEAIRKKGLPMSLKASGLDGALRSNADDTFDAIVASGKDADDGLKKVANLVNDNIDSVASSEETTGKLIDKAGEGNKIQGDDLAHNIDQARAIALRTQSVEDILKNIFKPILNRLLFAVEEIAKFVADHFGGDFTSDAAQQAKDMAQVPGAIKTLNATLDTKMSEKAKLDDKARKGKLSSDEQKQYDDLKKEIKIGTDTLGKLESIQEQQNFLSQGQEDNFNESLDKINKGQIAQMKDAQDIATDPTQKMRDAAIAMTGPAGMAYLSARPIVSTIVNHFSSESTHENTVPMGGNVSSGEHASNPKPPAAGTGGTQRRPMDDR